MTTPWWRSAELPVDPDAERAADFPPLLPTAGRDIRAAVRDRIPAYTPDWTPGPVGDPGSALITVFGEQAAPVFAQADRLRDKYRRELLRIAGVTGRERGVGRTVVVVTLLPTAADSVPVPTGTQLTAPGAGGGERVVFETERDLYATPALPAHLIGQVGDRSTGFTLDQVSPVQPVPVFGRRPQPGNGLWIGFDGPLPHPRLTLEIVLAGTDRGDGQAPVPRWELLTAAGRIPADVHADETDGLRRSGIVEIGTRRDWPVLPAPGTRTGLPLLRWLRIGLRQGRYDTPPMLVAVRPNAVRVAGFETVRNETLTPEQAPGATGAPRSFRTARRPVLRGTIRIEIDAPDVGAGDSTTGWTEVPSLAVCRPFEKVFELDGEEGLVTFGDGVHGALVPPGFRQVRAVSYRTGGGAATNVDAEAGFAPRATIPFLAGIGNPSAAAGGRDAEQPAELIARGPALLRCRNRAITTADVEVLAPDADAGVGRVIALPGRDSEGAARPGRLTLLVVGTGTPPGPPPVPPAPVLDAVTAYFDGPRAPRIALGARITVEPARFVPVQLEITAQVGATADRAGTLLAVARAADAYLDPRTGGDNGRGWPPGAAIRYRRLLAVIALVAGVTSVRRIGVRVAGRAGRPCTDAPLPPFTLPWPEPHLVIAVAEGDSS